MLTTARLYERNDIGVEQVHRKRTLLDISAKSGRTLSFQHEAAESLALGGFATPKNDAAFLRSG